MQTGDLTLFQTGVWLIPIILLATVGGLFWLVHYWRQKADQDLKLYRHDLRRAQGQRKTMESKLLTYTATDQEPYASRLNTLQTRLSQFDQQVMDLEVENVALRERINSLAANTWQATVGAPFFWFTLRKEVARLRQASAGLQDRLEAAGQAADDLNRLGLEVAGEARQVRDLYQQVANLLQALQTHNVQGAGMQAATQQEEQLRAALDQIPPFFLRGGEATVLQQANQENVSLTFTLLAETRPLLGQLFEQLQAWQQQHTQTSAKVAELHQALERLDQALAQTPPALNLSPVQAQHEEHKSTAQSLQATLAAVELEHLGGVSEKADQTRQDLEALTQQVQQAHQQQAELERLIPELNGGLKSLSAQFAALGTHSTHPIAWDRSQLQLTNLSRQVASLGSEKKTRTPQQLSLDLTSAAKLNQQIKELAAHCTQTAVQHGEILNLLALPEVSQGSEWHTNALNLAERAGQYAPENWPSQDDVAHFADQLRAIYEGVQYLAAPKHPEPIPEADVAQSLEEIRQLVSRYQGLRARSENIQRRLNEVQAAEQAAQDQINSARAALNQLELLARSNAFLQQTAAQDINRLQNQQAQLSGELDQRGHNTIEKKLRSVSAFLTRIEQSASEWLSRMNKEMEAQKKELGDQVTGLEAVAPLDEPAVAEARRLLSIGQSFGGGGFALKNRLGLDEIILELKRRSDHWQSSEAALQALDDIAEPLLNAYAEASQNRQHAQDQLNQLNSWLRSNRGWPPTSLTLDAENQELNRLEGQWTAIKQQPDKAIQLVAQLSSLSGRYSNLAGKARQVGEKIGQEYERIETLDTELDELAQLWQQQAQAYRDNPLTTDEIRKLLGEMDNERNQLKRQYRQGAKRYDQILQSLQSLHRRARLSQVTVDENHVIDVNGRVIAYR